MFSDMWLKSCFWFWEMLDFHGLQAVPCRLPLTKSKPLSKPLSDDVFWQKKHFLLVGFLK